MYDRELLLALLRKVLWSTEQILRRVEPFQSGDDFLKDDAGIEKLDSICMQLIAIGETLKQIDRITKGELLRNYPEVDWKGAKGMRENKMLLLVFLLRALGCRTTGLRSEVWGRTRRRDL
ncbi:MAG: antitoxin [Candidatus Caldatribacterium sp.]|nr:antitoxin [Candidatus Caldatribacterium sp.]